MGRYIASPVLQTLHAKDPMAVKNRKSRPLDSASENLLRAHTFILPPIARYFSFTCTCLRNQWMLEVGVKQIKIKHFKNTDTSFREHKAHHVWDRIFCQWLFRSLTASTMAVPRLKYVWKLSKVLVTVIVAKICFSKTRDDQVRVLAVVNVLL